MSPHSRAERGLRDAVLALAPKAEFARRMVNSGRLSLPSVYDSPLSTPDEAPFAGASKLGAPLPDAPVTRPDGTPAHLLENLRGGFELICVKADDDGDGWRHVPDGNRRTVIGEDLFDRTRILTQRFDATPGAAYLVRPDQHLCARWRRFDAGKVAAAHARALGR
jgi:3-(3-hydroxy-phenyl)propionate hydroxylase